MSAEEVAGQVLPADPAGTESAGTQVKDVPPPAEELRRGSPFEALQHRDFRLYWTGSFVSQVGSQMRIVAIGVQLWDLTHSYAALGLLGLAKLVPVRRGVTVKVRPFFTCPEAIYHYRRRNIDSTLRCIASAQG